MGRRAIPKTDRGLDLSRHLWDLDHLPQPWDHAAVFDRRAPLEVEVGSGKGLFLLTASQSRTEHDFLGIEVVGKYARFSAARLARHQIHNAAVLHGDAIVVLDRLMVCDSLAAVHVYFPDPWWKKRHRRRRVMNDVFVTAVQRCLSPGGELHFWTDVEQYFHESVQLILRSTALVGPFEVAELPAVHDMDYRTHFERRVRRNNNHVYRALFRKTPWHVQLMTDPDYRGDIVELEHNR